MSAEKPPSLKVADLFSKRQQRDTSRLKAYNEILKLIHKKISTASEIQDHPSNITYTVPPFILGLPKLDLEDCIVYLVHILRQGGFHVRYTYPNLLAVSWQHHEYTYLTKQNPIIQAMVPPPKPLQTSTKKKSVQFSDRGIAPSSLSLPAPFNPFGESEKERAPPRVPGEYQPPATFLNSLERPTKGVLQLWH